MQTLQHTRALTSRGRSLVSGLNKSNGVSRRFVRAMASSSTDQVSVSSSKVLWLQSRIDPFRLLAHNQVTALGFVEWG